ncbi:hypothetical protein D1AOALGA4SA_8481 [Olavius algarvensis Delta 1 endosymbiont]|nr:hypothetical protein D1AOALGA4SA_8481 [Olavius algarvensis Delta 1 endosymbiont]
MVNDECRMSNEELWRALRSVIIFFLVICMVTERANYYHFSVKPAKA